MGTQVQPQNQGTTTQGENTPAGGDNTPASGTPASTSGMTVEQLEAVIQMQQAALQQSNREQQDLRAKAEAAAAQRQPVVQTPPSGGKDDDFWSNPKGVIRDVVGEMLKEQVGPLARTVMSYDRNSVLYGKKAQMKLDPRFNHLNNPMFEQYFDQQFNGFTGEITDAVMIQAYINVVGTLAMSQSLQAQQGGQGGQPNNQLNSGQQGNQGGNQPNQGQPNNQQGNQGKPGFSGIPAHLLPSGEVTRETRTIKPLRQLSQHEQSVARQSGMSHHRALFVLGEIDQATYDHYERAALEAAKGGK